MTTDTFDLARFVDAQNGCYDAVKRELSAGRKQTHWMWFVFPQMRGLGRSATAAKYGISGREEALAYLAHPTLGPRLIECTDFVIASASRTAHEIFGSPDDMKFHSSMTLFDVVKPNAIYADALRVFFHGQRDAATLKLLDAG